MFLEGKSGKVDRDADITRNHASHHSPCLAFFLY